MELQIQQHAQCGCHCLQYDSWCWKLTDGREIESMELKVNITLDNGITERANRESPTIAGYDSDFNS